MISWVADVEAKRVFASWATDVLEGVLRVRVELVLVSHNLVQVGHYPCGLQLATPCGL